MRCYVCFILMTVLVSVASAQPLEGLRQAVDGDAAAWSQAVEDAVSSLRQMPAMNNRVVWALGKVMEIEMLRPVGDESQPPDAQTAERIGELLSEADRYLTQQDGARVPPTPPMPRQGSGNTALDALRRGPTPLALKALVELGLTVPSVTHGVLMVLPHEPYPEMRPLAEHVLATHVGGDTEANVISRVIYEHLPIDYPEAAGLIYLLRGDNFWNVQSGILRNWRNWTGPRLLHILPQMVLSSQQEVVASQAGRTLAELAGLDVPGDNEWTAAPRAEAYRAWRELPAEQRPALPPLLPPEWDGDDPVVAALAVEFDALTQTDCAAVLSDVGGPAETRQAGMRALIFEGTDATWQTVLDHIELETDWSVIGYALTMAEACLPERAGALRESLIDRLRTEGEAGVRNLALALTEAQDHEGVAAVAKLGAEVNREALCGICRDVAYGQTEPVLCQTRSFAALRNTITAYAEVDREGAAAFYQSLLQSPTPRTVEVGIYGCGELRVAEAIPELLNVLVPENENCMVAGSVCVALGKIGTPAAHEALVGLLTRPDVTDRMAWEVAVVMNSICGEPGRSPTGTWENGTWWTETELPAVTAAQFGAAITAYAETTTDERVARQLRGRAGVRGTQSAPAPPPPPAPATGQAAPPPVPAPAPPRRDGATDASHPLRRLAEAVDADAAGWTAAVREAVAGLRQQQAEGPLYAVAAAEHVRPVGEGVAMPDEAIRQRLREMLEARSRNDGAPRPPSTQEEPDQQVPTPEAIKALLDVLIANDSSTMTMVALKSFHGLARYPESARLIEHFMTAPTAAANRDMIVWPLAHGQVPYRYAEAACLLFLLQGDRGGYSHENVLSFWRRWREGGQDGDEGQSVPQSPPRLAQVLPYLLISYNDGRAAQAAAAAMADVWDLQVPGGDERTLARRVALYRAWRDLPAERKAAVPALISPDWDAANPVVAALQAEFERVSGLDHAAIAANRDADLPVRMAALRALMFEGADADWQVATRVVAAETDLKVLTETAAMARQIDPDHGEPLYAGVIERLKGQGAEGVRQISEALLTASTRDAVVSLAQLAAAVDTEAVCALCESIAASQMRPVFWQSDGFRELRNSVTAYDAVAHDRAAALYLSLLRSGQPQVREVGVYGCGELRVAEAVPELPAAIVPENENCFHASAVCVALGKIGTREAHDALIGMLGHTDLDDRRKHEVATVMTSICGRPGRSPDGTWENGTWYTVTPDRAAIGPRFAEALRQAADRASEERAAGQLRGRADMIMRAPAE